MGFVDKLRSAKHFGYSNPNRGTEELLNASLREAMQENRLEGGYYGNQGGGFRGGGRGYLNPGGRGSGGSQFTSNGRGMTLPSISGTQGMNVVYDQRPEMATKEMNLKKQGIAQDAKLDEAKTALMKMKMNDEFIDNRRKTALDEKQVATQDWAARNLKPGEMSDREKAATEYANRSALQTKDNVDSWVAKREANEGAERIAGMRGNSANETAETRAAASIEAANIRAAAMEEAARMRLEASGKGPKPAPIVAPAPVVAPDAIGQELERLLEPGAAQSSDAMRRDVARRANPNVDIPPVKGVNSSALGTNVGGIGTRIDDTKALDSRGNINKSGTANAPGFVEMIDPKGRPLRVPVNEVEAMLKAGAKRR